MVKPLGLFEPGNGQSFKLHPAELRAVSGQLSSDLRPLVAQYLRSGAVVFALMGYTDDVLEGRFSVAGGAGLNTDGLYYWRPDMADYIECYGLGVSSEALTHMEACGWRAPSVSEGEVSEVRDYLLTLLPHRDGGGETIRATRSTN